MDAQTVSHTSNNRQALVETGHLSVVVNATAGNYIPSPQPKKFKKVSLLPLVFLIFYGVSGGPFGIEDTVGAAGPLLALVGFLVFPFVWSVPEALITAEMGTMFPENGGYVVWVSAALGDYWGFQQGWMKWLSGVIDNALYPVLFLDYLKSVLPVVGHGYPRTLSVLVLTAALTYTSYRGVAIVGWVAVLLGVVSVLPFVVMVLLAIPKLEPARWLVVDFHNVKWGLYLNTLFWNLNYWDGISTLAGEVENPKKTLPKALFYALIFVICAYFFPLLAGTGAIPLHRELWEDGYFADVAKVIGGTWLCWWVQGAAAMSNMGLFIAEMSGDSFLLLGMAEQGMIPELFSMILEFITFIVLRVKQPAACRPFKVPLGTFGSVLMCVPPAIFMCVVLALASVKVMVVSLIAVTIGLVLQPSLRYLERKGVLKFSKSTDLPDLQPNVHGNDHSLVS